MLTSVVRTRAIIVLCLGISLAGCSLLTRTVELDPTLTGTASSVRFVPLPPQRFQGQPMHIGFEPIPLEGGDFQILTDFVFLPGDDEFLALNRMGKVGHFRLEEDRAVMLGSFQIPAVFIGGDCAASSLTLDNNFALTKQFYVGYCIDTQYSVIKRYTMTEPDFSETLFTSANVIAVGDPKADVPQHALGMITFGPDGVMWANVGERRRGENAQDLTNELGKIIRFIPVKQPNVSGYANAEGNAFTPDNAPNSLLIYAYGLRNPWRGAFDSRGRYWVADVGATRFEEINLISKRGQNFGWPVSEGPLCFTGSCTTFVPPVRHWSTSQSHPFILEDPLSKRDSLFRTAWIGLEYRPSGGVTDPYKGLLANKMLYGDFYIGFVRGVTVSATGAVLSDHHLGHIELPVAWRQRDDGYVYVGTMFQSYDRSRDEEGGGDLLPQAQQGMLWRVVPLP